MEAPLSFGLLMEWMHKAWADFRASFDPEEVVASSSPASIVLGPGSLVLALLVLGYVPPLERLTGLERAWLPAALVALGAVFTFTAWHRRVSDTAGILATLLDNATYSAALVLAAVSCRQGTGMALGIVHAMLVVLVPARYYALTPLFGFVMVAPIIAVVAIARPSLPVGVVLVASSIMYLMVSEFTREQRREREHQKQLEAALGAADKVADESVQTALTTTLLTLGHFLHELRNYQTAIGANLEFISEAAELPPEASDALRDASDAQERQADLVRGTINDLRNRSSSEHRWLQLREMLEDSTIHRPLPMRVSGDLDFEVAGNPESMRVVLLNLLRNAEQAGASSVSCVAKIQSSGTSVSVSLRDDGKGIPVSRVDGLFDSFARSDKPGGSGLGLYLVRRHVELLGGTIEVHGAQDAGASFLIRLPGRRPRRSSVPAAVSA